MVFAQRRACDCMDGVETTDCFAGQYIQQPLGRDEYGSIFAISQMPPLSDTTGIPVHQLQIANGITYLNDLLVTKKARFEDGANMIGDSRVEGSLNVLGALTVAGIKAAVVETSQGPRCMSAENLLKRGLPIMVWQAGEGTRSGSIDPLFAETVNLEKPYHVFVQLNDVECEGLAVLNKTSTAFEVRECEVAHRVRSSPTDWWRCARVSRLSNGSAPSQQGQVNPESKLGHESSEVLHHSDGEVRNYFGHSCIRPGAQQGVPTRKLP